MIGIEKMRESKLSKTVCVYCGSSNVDQIYKDAAIDTGEILAGEACRVIYGGGNVGLMGLVADTALKNGAEVVGIIPHHIEDREIGHEGLTELHVVDTMHERKQMMAERADAFVILPGGLGTLDEFFEIVTWKQLGLHDKPVVLVNVNNYWTRMIEAVDHIAGEGFMRATDRNLFIVVDKPGDIPQAIRNAPAPVLDVASKWI